MKFPTTGIGWRSIFAPLMVALLGLGLIRVAVPVQSDGNNLVPVFCLIGLMILVVACALWSLSLELASRDAVRPTPTAAPSFENALPSSERQLETKYALAITAVAVAGFVSLQVGVSSESKPPTRPASRRPGKAAIEIPSLGGGEKEAGSPQGQL